jgi:ribonuclease HII
MVQSTLIDGISPGDNFSHERLLYTRGYLRVAGTDEAGRGPLAGPVVAACVVLPPCCDHHLFIDSKQTTLKQRQILFAHLIESGAAVGIGRVSEATIDRINILQASLLAMKRAVEDVPLPQPDYLLVDGKFSVPLNLPQDTFIKGESRSSSIAAASIAAKITRDEIMAQLHEQYPDYNFLKNKGYPTKEHREALARLGPSACHRKTFKGVREHVKQSTTPRQKR